MNFINKVLAKIMASTWIVNLIGLKAIYQFIYIIFNLFIVKKLNVAEYGSYSYIVALIVYFSTIPLLGLPQYLQRNIARNRLINYRYLILMGVLASISLIFTYFAAISEMSGFQKFAILTIILANSLLVFPVAVKDGIGAYSFQYKFLLFNSLWMIICIVNVTCFTKTISFDTLLSYWLVNSIISLFLLIYTIFGLCTSVIKFSYTNEIAYPMILFDLLLLYTVYIPEGFSRFYDRYLAHTYLSDNFLGSYSFNLLIVNSVYALFIRPINSIVFTKLAKANHSINESVSIIKKYLFSGLCIYLILYCLYIPFSEQILSSTGLIKYIGTTRFFDVCFVDAILFFITVPFAFMIALSHSQRMKIAYCIISLLLFNLPLVCLLINNSELSYFISFILAYSFNLLLVLVLQRELSLFCFKSIMSDFSHSIKYRYAKLLNQKG